MENKVIIVGAGIAGLTAAISLAQNGHKCILISNQASERAGSCMAEGGINAALDSYGDGDTTENHYNDTCKNAHGVADPAGIRLLTEAAPSIVTLLHQIGVQFTLTENNRIAQRYFGGQKFRRTAYAGDCTGKQVMTALIDEARKYEAKGLIERLSHHSFIGLIKSKGRAAGCIIADTYTGASQELMAPAVIMATGGYHGLFGNTTGAKVDDGEATARLFAQGVAMGNLEFIQYHPTTFANGSKRLLMTEAARGEGGRLCILRDGQPYYFMEDKYPELKNLMPRDVTAREIAAQPSQVYLDLTGLDRQIFEHKLKGLSEDCNIYLGLDPARDLIPVSPGIHYFMGGIFVDTMHRTNITGLYAAGECASCYHGANRIGGNSLLGAAYGGRRAAQTALEEMDGLESLDLDQVPEGGELDTPPAEKQPVAEILNKSMGISRNEEALTQALQELEGMDSPMALLARASVMSALNRRESRGAHYRSDYTEENGAYDGATRTYYDGKEIRLEIHHFH